MCHPATYEFTCPQIGRELVGHEIAGDELDVEIPASTVANECAKLCLQQTAPRCVAFETAPGGACRLRSKQQSQGESLLEVAGSEYYEFAWSEESRCLHGCRDPSARNFNPLAQENDEPSCDFSAVQVEETAVECEAGACTELALPGCTDRRAVNFQPGATVDDGSCHLDPCTLGVEVHGCPLGLSVCFPLGHMQHSCRCNTDLDLIDTLGDGTVCEARVQGCTDEVSANYNADANWNDGTCTYALDNYACPPQRGYLDGNPVADVVGTVDTTTRGLGADQFPTREACAKWCQENVGCLSFDYGTYSHACQLNSAATGTLTTNQGTFEHFVKVGAQGTCGDYVDDDGCGQHRPASAIVSTCEDAQSPVTCMDEARWGCFRHGVYGCTDASAANFDGSVTDPEEHTCVEALYGCTNSSAVNHDPNATLNNGSCIHNVSGCTDRNAANYASTATVDDGSCECRCGYVSNTRTGGQCALEVHGCTDAAYDNYDAASNVHNHSSCENHIFRFACGEENLIATSNYHIQPDNSEDRFHQVPAPEDCARLCDAYQPTCRSFHFSATEQKCYLNGPAPPPTVPSWPPVLTEAAGYVYYELEDEDADPIVARCQVFVGASGQSCDQLQAGRPAHERCSSNAECTPDESSPKGFTCSCRPGFIDHSDEFPIGVQQLDAGAVCLRRVYGCTAPNHLNYDRRANVAIEGSCVPFVPGCADVNAFNYNPNATLTGDENCEEIVLAQFSCPANGIVVNGPRVNTPFAAGIDSAVACAELCTNLLNEDLVAGHSGCRSFSFTPTPAIVDGQSIQCYLYEMRVGEVHANTELVLTEHDGQHYDWWNASSSACSYGCMDSSGASFNYDPGAEEDDGSCRPAIAGCNDPTALNHNSLANVADGSCVHEPIRRFRCPFSLTLSQLTTLSQDHALAALLVVADEMACAKACLEHPSCIGFDYRENMPGEGQCFLRDAALEYVPCVNCHVAYEHYALAPLDWSGCTSGCMVPGMFNYNPRATEACVPDCCVPAVHGCNDTRATNFHADVNTDDGSCMINFCSRNEDDCHANADCFWVPPRGYSCSCREGFAPPPGLDISQHGRGLSGCESVSLGCTDDQANNYNPAANIDDFTCAYDSEEFSCAASGQLGGNDILVDEDLCPGCYPAWNLPASGNMVASTQRTRGQCASMCLNTAGCRSFDHSHITSTCHLNDDVVSLANPILQDAVYNYYVKVVPGVVEPPCTRGCTSSQFEQYDAANPAQEPYVVRSNTSYICSSVTSCIHFTDVERNDVSCWVEPIIPVEPPPEPEPEPERETQNMILTVRRTSGRVMNASEFASLAEAVTNRRAQILSVSQNASAQVRLTGLGWGLPWTSQQHQFMKRAVATTLGMVSAESVIIDSVTQGRRRQLQTAVPSVLVDYTASSTVDIATALNQLVLQPDDFDIALADAIVTGIPVFLRPSAAVLQVQTSSLEVAVTETFQYTLDVLPNDETEFLDSSDILEGNTYEVLLLEQFEQHQPPLYFEVEFTGEPALPVIHCVGAWSACGVDCFQHFSVSTVASGGGQECEEQHGAQANCAPGQGSCPLPQDCSLSRCTVQCETASARDFAYVPATRCDGIIGCTGTPCPTKVDCLVGDDQCVETVNCAGTWSTCAADCEPATYSVTVMAAGLGTPCTHEGSVVVHGQTRPCPAGEGNCPLHGGNLEQCNHWSRCTDDCEESSQRTWRYSGPALSESESEALRMACGNVAPDCQAGDGRCRESFFLPEDGSATRGSNIWVLLIVFCSIPTVLIALVCLYVKQLKQDVGKDTAGGAAVTRTNSPMRGGPGPLQPRPNQQATVAPFTDLGLQEANPIDISSVSRQDSGRRGAAPPLPASSPRRAERVDEQDSAALTPTVSRRSAPPLPASRSPRSFRNAAAAVRATSHMADAGADAGMARQMDADLEAGGGLRRLQSVHAPQLPTHKHQLEAPEKLRTALDALADNQFDNCMYNLNLALRECAPMVAQPQGTLAVQLLQEAVLYKLCACVFRGVQHTAALMKQQTEPLPPQASRRQVLLCIFLCSLTDLQPKHRVRFIRRTIQLSMRNGNYGLAAPYIQYLMGLAQGRSRAKAETELQQCRERQFVNTADVPDLSRVVDVTNMGLDQSVAYLEQARGCAVAEAEDLASLGLAYHLLGDPAKSLECLEGSLARTVPGGVDEAEVQASLCLAYYAVQQPQRADEAWVRAMEVYAAVLAGATQ